MRGQGRAEQTEVGVVEHDLPIAGCRPRGGSPTGDALRLLASWAATQEAEGLTEQPGAGVEEFRG